MTAKKMEAWTIVGTASSATGLVYALYDINAKGEVIDWSDPTGDGVIDAATTNTGGVSRREYAVQSTNADGRTGRIAGVIDEPISVFGAGVLLETLIEGTREVLSWF